VNEDYRDILAALIRHDARFLLVGAHALAIYGYPRATADIDIWIESSPQNAQRVWNALAEFGAPLQELNVRPADLTQPHIVAQFGLPPNRIDILTGVTGLTFERAWENRIEEDLAGVRVPVIGREDLITNKRMVGRPQDLLDVDVLERPES